ncbi:hypothetical protein GGI05_002000 [Coemansia sp. RSA 2603]|nr:hypothetical protein GGI05_002000 [Coemansia sp. RSA 2603]
MNIDEHSIHSYPQVIAVPQRAILKAYAPSHQLSTSTFSQPASDYQNTLAIIPSYPWTTGADLSSLRTTAPSSSLSLPSQSTSSVLSTLDDDMQIYPHLVNKPPTADIEYYFNNKNSVLYDKRTRKLKERAPNAFMLYRLSQIKDLKGKRHSPTFINNTISNAWASLPLEDKGFYSDLSRLLQTRLNAIHKQSANTPKTSKPKQPDIHNNSETDKDSTSTYAFGTYSYLFHIERSGNIGITPIYSAVTTNPHLSNLVECVSDDADCGIQFLA